MFRLQLPEPGYYTNQELTQEQFGAIATGADTTLGLAVWSHDTNEYVNTLSADQVPLAYVAWNRDNLP
jgi:hypothetical protein